MHEMTSIDNNCIYVNVLTSNVTDSNFMSFINSILKCNFKFKKSFSEKKIKSIEYTYILHNKEKKKNRHRFSL